MPLWGVYELSLTQTVFYSSSNQMNSFNLTRIHQVKVNNNSYSSQFISLNLNLNLWFEFMI